MQKRHIEYYVIYLKEDLKIADTFNAIKTTLLDTITKNDYFSEELAAYFVKTNPQIPFHVLPTDPSQVAVLKKLINAFEHAEKALRSVENINIDRSRYTVGLYTDVAKVSYQVIHEIYAALQLINRSNSDIQEIIAPHINQLMPKMAAVFNALEQFAPGHAEERTGKGVADLIKMLPEEKYTRKQSFEKISHLIFDLPHYFEELQKLIATGDAGVRTKSITSTKEYQAAMAKKAKDTQEYFEKLSTKSGIAALPSYLVIVKRLLAHSSELLNTGAPLTKQAYLHSVEILKEIKHELLPQLLAELEQLEEGMCLKSGTLTDPILKQMEPYYTQLATQVDAMAKAAGVLDTASDYLGGTVGTIVRYLAGDKKQLNVGQKLQPVAELTVMMDDHFIAKRRLNQITRLNEAQLKTDVTQEKEAATRFFARLDAYNMIHQSICKWSLANINQSEKEALLVDYKQFQSYFAALHPDIDRIIVDALTQPTGSSFVARLYSSEYKQLWSYNHFTKILACKNAVLDSIEQHKAQAKFNTRLIENTINHAQEVAYHTNKQTTHLTADVSAYQHKTYSVKRNKSAEYYHNKVLAVANQISELKRAQEGVREFFNYLTAYSLAGTPPRHTILGEPLYKSLTVNDKEFLRASYKKFQPYFIAMGYNDLNKQLVEILNDPTPYDPKSPPLRLAHILSQNPLVEAKLAQYMNDAQQGKKDYCDQKHLAQHAQIIAKPLHALGAELEKRTLLGMLNELKLSQSIDQFMRTKFQTYLKDNLSEPIWRQLSEDGKTLDMNKIPYTELYQDGPEVKMYKQLINSFHYMKTGLEELAALHHDGDPESVIYRYGFVKKAFNALLGNIRLSRNHLLEAAKNPGLQAMIEEGLNLLEPIKNIPFLGEYVKTTKYSSEPIVSKPDIIAAWQAQQELVNTILHPQPQPQKIAEPEESKVASERLNHPLPQTASKTAESGYVQLIAEQLYQLPIALNRFKHNGKSSSPSKAEVDAQIKEFVEGLNGLSFGPGSAKKVLNTLSKLQIQLSEIGFLSRDIAMSHLKEIRSEFGILFMEAADNVEFHLGLKPGTYSAVVNERFEQFYRALLVNLPFHEEQTGLELLDLTTIQKRLAREDERYKIAQADQGVVPAKKQLLSDNYKTFDHVFNSYKALAVLYKQFDELEDPSGLTIEELKENAKIEYQKLYPLLKAINSGFTEDLINNTRYEYELKDAIFKIRAVREQILVPATAFERLQAFILDVDFSKKADQVRFLRYYEEIQPYLQMINTKYDYVFFLRELQTPDDFQTALSDIVSTAPKLEQLMQGLETARQLKIKLAQDRVNYFEAMLGEHAEVFKDTVWNNYLNGNLKSALESALATQAEPFFQYILPAILAKKTTILAEMDIRNSIEDNLVTQVKQVSATIIAANREPFKEALFKQRIDQIVERSSASQLGFYTQAFIQALWPEYDKSKKMVLNQIPFDQDMGEKIASAVDGLSPAILHQHHDLQNVFSTLNQTLERVEKQLEQERLKSENNPCRTQKIALLTALQRRLTDTQSIPQQGRIAFLEQMNTSAHRSLKDIANYDELIHIYDVLAMLKEKIPLESGTLQDNAEKIKVIAAIQAGLADEHNDVPARLAQAVHKLSATSKGGGLRNTDNFLIGEAFKEQVFDNYLYDTLATQMQTELGPYTATFIQQISADFMAQKSAIVHDLPIAHIGSQIVKACTQHQAHVFEKNQQIKNMCTILGVSLKVVSQVINEEESLFKTNPANSCRKEKINELKKYQLMLMDTASIPANNVLPYLQERNHRMQKLLTRVSDYDMLIHVHDTLDEMKTYVTHSKENTPELKKAKIARLGHMETMLHASKEPAVRLRNVKNYGLSDPCQSILRKNSDNPFITLIKKFISLFTGASQEETMVSEFKQRLQDIKIASDSASKAISFSNRAN